MSDRLKALLRQHADAERVPILQRFFKIGPGGYAEGDEFIGVTVPHVRQVCRQCRGAGIDDIEGLLRSSNSGFDHIRKLRRVIHEHLVTAKRVVGEPITEAVPCQADARTRIPRSLEINERIPDEQRR